MAHIFINYRRQDSEGYVGRLYDYLTTNFDPDDIIMDTEANTADVVAGCDVFIAIIGPQWTSLTDEVGQRLVQQPNDSVRIEIATALKHNKLIIPVLVGQTRMPSPSDLSDDLAALSRRNAIELSHSRFKYDAEKLVKTIRDSTKEQQNFKATTDVDTLQRKSAALDAMRTELLNAVESPLYSYRVEQGSVPVLGDGNPDANILFIGEAPGRNEAKHGKPFIGRSGDVFDEMLRSINLNRADVFVTNILLDQVPDKRKPTKQELDFYTPFVDRIINIIQPAVIVPLGQYAMQYIMKTLDLPEKRQTITQLHGKMLKAKLDYGQIHVVPLYHPAVVLYSANQRETLLEDFEILKVFV